jgi:hypothetical protein
MINSKLTQWMAGFSFVLLLLGLYLLRPQQQVVAQKGIYFWKTNFYKSTDQNDENTFLDRHQIKKVYIKMIDVDYNEAAGIFPASKTDINYYADAATDSCQYIPVIYISNEVLKHLNKDNAEIFANKFISHALRIYTYTKVLPSEIQIDCDWTKGTKEAYFNLLLAMKKIAPQFTYSVTLRLYPYKYSDELGVPPVNRVMLMLYNMENAKNFNNENSLFNANEARKYLKRKAYPLPMDVALPVFSWTLVFRNQRFLNVYTDNIVPKISLQEYNEEPQFTLASIAQNKYLVEKATRSVYNNYDLKVGDILKVESCGENELKQAKMLLNYLPLTEQSTIALFDLDLNELNKLSHEQIEAAYTFSR